MKESYPYLPDWQVLELCYESEQGYKLIVRSLDSGNIYYWAVSNLNNWRYTFEKCKVHTNETFNRNFFYQIKVT